MPALRNVNPNRYASDLSRPYTTPIDADRQGVMSDSAEATNQDPKLEPLDDDQLVLSYPPSISLPPEPSSPIEFHFPEASIPRQTISLPPRRPNSCRRRSHDYIPRPRNAFIFFRSDFINGRAASGEGQQNELSKLAGKCWGKLSSAERQPYLDMAAQEKIEHQQLYPNYIYAPGRIGGKQRSRPGVRRPSASGTSSRRKVSSTRDFEAAAAVYPSSGSSETPSPVLESLHLPPYPRVRVQRVAAQRAARNFQMIKEESPAISSSSSSPSNDQIPPTPPLVHSPREGGMDLDLGDFVRTDDIPPLNLDGDTLCKIEEFEYPPQFFIPDGPIPQSYFLDAISDGSVAHSIPCDEFLGLKTEEELEFNPVSFASDNALSHAISFSYPFSSDVGSLFDYPEWASPKPYEVKSEPSSPSMGILHDPLPEFGITFMDIELASSWI